MKNFKVNDGRPWYKEPWPWLLMLGPCVVVIAGLCTAWIAVKSDDGLVTGDYYKKGLNMNQTLLSSAQAQKSGLRAGIRLSVDGLSVRLQTSDSAFVLPKNIVATISHPTRAGLDQTFILRRSGDGYLSESLHLPLAGHWLVLLEDEKKTWRLLGNIILPAQGETLIGWTQPQQARDVLE